MPKDRHGNVVDVGTRVRLTGLSGQWLEDLPPEEKVDVLSMVGEVFEIEEVDEYGSAWVSREWSGDGGRVRSHSLALAADEMEVVGNVPD